MYTHMQHFLCPGTNKVFSSPDLTVSSTLSSSSSAHIQCQVPVYHKPSSQQAIRVTICTTLDLSTASFQGRKCTSRLHYIIGLHTPLAQLHYISRYMTALRDCITRLHYVIALNNCITYRFKTLKQGWLQVTSKTGGATASNLFTHLEALLHAVDWLLTGLAKMPPSSPSGTVTHIQ